jgi:hypothetical protein
LFSPGPPVSSTNKTDCHDITEILLKVALNTIKQTNKQTNKNESPPMEYLLVPSGQFCRLSWRRQVTILIRKNNDDVCFVQTKTPSLILIVLAHRSSSP